MILYKVWVQEPIPSSSKFLLTFNSSLYLHKVLTYQSTPSCSKVIGGMSSQLCGEGAVGYVVVAHVILVSALVPNSSFFLFWGTFIRLQLNIKAQLNFECLQPIKCKAKQILQPQLTVDLKILFLYVIRLLLLPQLKGMGTSSIKSRTGETVTLIFISHRQMYIYTSRAASLQLIPQTFYQPPR